jgi:hypothetical protein
MNSTLIGPIEGTSSDDAQMIQGIKMDIINKKTFREVLELKCKILLIINIIISYYKSRALKYLNNLKRKI